MSCIHAHYAPERLAGLAAEAGWSVDEVAGLLAFCIGHEIAGERGPCDHVSISWADAYELAGCLAEQSAPVSAAQSAAASAVLAEFGEYPDGEEPNPAMNMERELTESAIELARQLYADGISEGRVAGELALLGFAAHLARIAAAVAATDRLADDPWRCDAFTRV